MSDFATTEAGARALAVLGSSDYEAHILLTNKLGSGYLLGQQGANKWAILNWDQVANTMLMDEGSWEWFPNSRIRALAHELGHIIYNNADHVLFPTKGISSPANEFENRVANQARSGDSYTRYRFYENSAKCILNTSCGIVE